MIELITIICKEDTQQKSFFCDKRVLIKSPYFRAMLEGNFKESNEDIITINYNINLFQYYFNYLNIKFYGGKYYVKHINMINILDYFSDDEGIELYTEIYQNKVRKAISQKKYNKLVDIMYIDFKNINNLDAAEIFKLNNEILKKIIDNIIDLECENNDGFQLIHLICFYNTPEIIKYIIDKGIDLECKYIGNWRLIHYICQYNIPEMIKYIIDKEVNLECKTNEKWRPIHLICRHHTPEIIKYIIDKGVNLECETNNNCQPIHLIKSNDKLTIAQQNELIKKIESSNIQ